MIRLFNQDCMTAMKEMPDKAFELAIVDPPYGIHDRLLNGAGFMKDSPQKRRYTEKQWDKDVPPAAYFDSLRRVSYNQIIWGGNYFDLPPTRCVIAWTKPQMVNHPAFSQWEMAWTSFQSSAKVFSCHPSSQFENSIHPTQKPVRLYEWLLKNYAKPGDKILDTHLGSGSSAIAADIMGFDFTGYEIDADYFQAAKERLERHQRQGVLPL
jgi:site-specific DNA-methyltransferase (adenine-specific)